MHNLGRRGFLKLTGLSLAAAAGGWSGAAEPEENVIQKTSAPHPLPRRPYGRDGVQISVIGMGGIVVMDADRQKANRIVGEALDRGVNYFDVAPTYGEAEVRLGQTLHAHREDVFLACKTVVRDRAGALAELERSLKRLRTDHLDLYQLHGLADVGKDVDPAFSSDGAMTALAEAKKNGKVRYLGFSAHSTAAALAAMARYDFDSVMFPVNFTCWLRSDLGPQVLETAREKGVTVIALKSMARQPWPQGDPMRETYGKCWYQPLQDRREVGLALRFTLSQSVAAAIPPGEETLFRLALDMAGDLRPLEPIERGELETAAAGLQPVFEKG